MLVIFDLNGTLCATSFRSAARTRARAPDGKARTKYYWIRPGAHRLVRSLLERGDEVAVWTSCPARNAEPLALGVLGEELYAQVRFVFAREQCTLVGDGMYGSKKDLRAVWRQFPQYDVTNTVLVDDSFDKVVQHPNHVPVHEYNPVDGCEDDGTELEQCRMLLNDWRGGDV